jgi:hypothetical protein
MYVFFDESSNKFATICDYWMLVDHWFTQEGLCGSFDLN